MHLVTVCTIMVLCDHFVVSFQGRKVLLCEHTCAAAQRGKAPPGGPSCIHGAGGGWLRVAGGPLCTPNTEHHIFFLPTPDTMALCWSRGASRYFRNHAGSCRGQREGARAQLRRGHQASTISTREETLCEREKSVERQLERGLGWA